jgi:hypothetical protein
MFRRSISDLLAKVAAGKISNSRFFAEKARRMPEKLYRYYRLSEPCLAEIRAGVITQRRADAQNDPFDSAFSIIEEVATMKLIETMSTLIERQRAPGDVLRLSSLGAIHETPGGVAEWARRQRAAIRISSFTERPDSLLMWSHYAGGHTGLCVEYDLSKNSGDEFSRSFYPVIYRDSFPEASEWIQYLDGTFRSFLFLVYAATIKSPEWSYEREWRSISSPADVWLTNRTLTFYAPCGREEYLNESNLQAPVPSAVILGAKASPAVRLDVMRCAEEMGFTLREARLRSASFQVEITPV